MFLALTAAAGVVALSIFANSAEQRRAQAMVDEVAAISASVTKAYGDAILAGKANVSVATVAKMGLVDGRYLQGNPATAIRNPWGDAISVSSTSGTPGYTVGLGYMPIGSCINVLTALATSDELTGLQYANANAPSTPSSLIAYQATYTANPLTLSATQIGSICAGMQGNTNGSGNGISLTLRNINAVTSANAFVSGPLPPVMQTVCSCTTTPILDTSAAALGQATYVAGVPNFAIAQTGQNTLTVTETNIGASVTVSPHGEAGVTTTTGGGTETSLGQSNVTTSLALNLPSGQQFSSLSVDLSAASFSYDDTNTSDEEMVMVSGQVTDSSGHTMDFTSYQYPPGSCSGHHTCGFTPITASCPSSWTCTGPLTLTYQISALGGTEAITTPRTVAINSATVTVQTR